MRKSLYVAMQLSAVASRNRRAGLFAAASLLDKRATELDAIVQVLPEVGFDEIRVTVAELRTQAEAIRRL